MTSSAFDICPIEEYSPNFLGYYVTSTASINVEEPPPPVQDHLVKQKIDEIAQYLVASDQPQVIISIHGYSNTRSSAEGRYRKIYQSATQICQPQTSVFLGYCWPAENPLRDDPDPNTGYSTSFGDKVGYAFQSLPTLLIGIFSSSLILVLITTLLLILGKPNPFLPLTIFFFMGILSFIVLASFLGTRILLEQGNALPLLPGLPIWVLFLGLFIGAVFTVSPINLQWILVLLLIVLVSSFAIILALILLRLATYFRDNYRANNYGVLDLVELIRQLDQAVYEKSATNNQSKRIGLTFIGHSMGCMVVTNIIRILSDVFDTNSINKNPNSEIGRVFCLERLILVAPDIPTESIMPRRANFLRSSLRRFNEAYVFCNEGDLALRLASTAANYFNFPARTRFSGYRLGNLTVRHFMDKNDLQVRRLSEEDYGIVNLKDGQVTEPYFKLEVRASHQEHLNLNEIRPLETVEKDKSGSVEDVVADLFTYFDCTDYIDYTSPEDRQPKGVVSYALKKSALDFWDYVQLTIAYYFKTGSQNINTHGAFFDGQFSYQAICQLAFLGFQGFLDNFKPDCPLSEQLDELSTICRNKYIQVVLSVKVKKLLNPTE
jgi:hypothetical protein